ncbi:MAG: hypothetical protein CSA40_00390 [Flavobacteriales bacterium]|nr:MAG: hypothetical protein CSA40_00390 [Flavobacteriales bacterium]
MRKIVLDGAKLFCNKGSKSSKITVCSQLFVKTDNKLVATEMDKVTGVNIQPFGICAITQKTCVPAPTQWLNTHLTDAINGSKILLDTSKCLCSMGGEITPIHVNYNGFAKYE